MAIKENLARTLRRIKTERQLSCREFADELAIPKSSLESYINGTGNPRADTLEMLAGELNVPLAEIVSGPVSGREQAEMIIRTVKELSSLSPEKRERGLQLFCELMALFSEEDPH